MFSADGYSRLLPRGLFGNCFCYYLLLVISLCHISVFVLRIHDRALFRFYMHFSRYCCLMLFSCGSRYTVCVAIGRRGSLVRAHGGLNGLIFSFGCRIRLLAWICVLSLRISRWFHTLYGWKPQLLHGSGVRGMF